ncbi:MAG: hypothetical protein MR038_07835 [Oscillospiraceae bacterium]|nr:hypothetical protein [Oscillospiraceae bacterium]
MKFGSVEFFKHLIISTVISVVIFAASFSMIFGIKASSESIRVSDKLPKTADAMSDAAEEGTPSGSGSDTENDTSAGAPDDDAVTETAPPVTDAPDETPADDEDEDKDENKDELNIPDGTTVEELFGALAGKGISAKDIIDYLFEHDSAYLDSFIYREAEKAAAQSVHSDAPAEDTPTIVTVPADEHPGLYADASGLPVLTDGMVCLTFESIVPDYLSDIFYILGEQDISAVVFLTCEEAEGLSDRQLAAIAEKGCSVGISLTGEGSLEEMNRAFERISSVTGTAPCAYICDGISDSLAAELDRRGFVRFGGRRVSGDSWSEIYNAAQDAVEASANGVVLRLDGGYYSVITAEDIISYLKNSGYTFVTI